MSPQPSTMRARFLTLLFAFSLWAPASANWFNGRGGGGRRSDINLKQDIVPLVRLANGLELYRFRYRERDQAIYVGVMAQDVEKIDPGAVSRDRDDICGSTTILSE
jgi:hypothetical protein